MPNFLVHLSQLQKGLLCVIVGLILLICIWLVGLHDPAGIMPRLVLIVVAFASAVGGMMLLSEITIAEVKAERAPDAESRIDTIVVGTILVVLVLLGALIETFGLATLAKNALRTTCIGLLASLATLAVGVLIGFLFGVPRSLAAPYRGAAQPAGQQQPPAQPADQQQPPAQPAGQQQPPAPPAAGYEPNTNLTQISDWLTKTIVGVGLVNWNNGLKWFGQTAAALGTSLEIGNGGSVVGGSIIVFFGATGFLCGYNLTQLFLARALAAASP